MRSGNWATYAAAVTLVLLSAASPSQAVTQEPFVTQDPAVSSAPVVTPDPVTIPDQAVTLDTVVTAPPVAKFSAISDAVPSKFFDAATTGPDAADANRLIIGFNAGIDFRTFTGNDFRASGFPFSNKAAMDTISFRIDAP